MNRIRQLSDITLVVLLVVFTIGFLSFFGVSAQAAESDYWASNQQKIESPDIKDEDSAYIIFSETPVMNGMSYIQPNGATRHEELYSEQVVFGELPCRQVYSDNKFYLKMDEGFSNDEDRIFSISFDYWNYGGGGYIYLDYYPAGSDNISTMTILKLGLDENNQKTPDCWYRVTVCIEDGHFGSGKMPYGADFRIRSGAYNAFSKFEVRNLSRNVGNEFLGIYNSQNYELQQKLGNFPSYAENIDLYDFYSKPLTREEALVMIIKGLGMEQDAISKNLSTSFSDVSAENAPYVALAEQLGVVNGGGILNKTEPFTQKELIEMYLKLLSVDVEEGADVYEIANRESLILKGNIIFQPERPADTDALAALSINALFLSNKKTGFNAFTNGVGNGKYDLGEFIKSGISPVMEWMRNNSFKIPKNRYYDETTGRTYYSIDFFGGHAAKSYYTMNCMANDNKRLYFLALQKYIMEYNIETEMCRYIDTYHGSGCLVTPLDNLWYFNTSLELIKIDLDTYEKEVVAKLPSWQKVAWNLQINNDESWLSCDFKQDGSGEVNTTTESRMARLNLKTGEWDLRYVFGFTDTGDPRPNHMCINPNPAYSNLYFFAHEGSNTELQTERTSFIPDRTWVLDFNTGIFTNAIKQKWLVTPNFADVRTGRAGEGGCHEAWSYDGEWIFNVTASWSISNIWYNLRDYDGMITMVRKDFTDKRIIPADYTLTRAQMSAGSGINHAMISYDNRWIAADCQYSSTFKRSDLYVFDTETGETHFLAKTAQKGLDPGHTHPQFSPNDKYVIFGLWSEDMAYAETAWMDISDITGNPSKGGRVQISESCEVLSYDCDKEHSIETVLDGDGKFEYATVPHGNYMYVDVKKEIIESDNTPGKISITYMDEGTTPLKLVYYTWHENAATRDVNVFKTNEIYINRTGTGKAITKIYKFDDICFGNMQILGTDFKIGAVGAPAKILSVDVSVDK